MSKGIFQEPVEDRIMLRTTNLDGDGQAGIGGAPNRREVLVEVDRF